MKTVIHHPLFRQLGYKWKGTLKGYFKAQKGTLKQENCNCSSVSKFPDIA